MTQFSSPSLGALEPIHDFSSQPWPEVADHQELAQSARPASESALRTLDPRTDPDWAAFVARHPRASVFHSPRWVEALSRTYGYKPVAWTTSPAGTPLRSGMIFVPSKAGSPDAGWSHFPFRITVNSLSTGTMIFEPSRKLWRTRCNAAAGAMLKSVLWKPLP